MHGDDESPNTAGHPLAVQGALRNAVGSAPSAINSEREHQFVLDEYCRVVAHVGVVITGQEQFANQMSADMLVELVFQQAREQVPPQAAAFGKASAQIVALVIVGKQEMIIAVQRKFFGRVARPAEVRQMEGLSAHHSAVSVYCFMFADC